nr:MAG TPA: Protein of unknown function (DUF2514) [Caudoviricetes sp.]
MVFMIQKYWKYFAAGSLILLLIFSYVLAMDRQYEKGRRSMAVEISNRLKVEALKQAAEVRQHELKAANTLAERQRELEKEKQDAEKTNADMRDELNRLREYTAVQRRAKVMPQTPSTSGASYGEESSQGWELFGKCAAEYAGMAEAADKQAADLAEWKAYGQTVIESSY